MTDTQTQAFAPENKAQPKRSRPSAKDVVQKERRRRKSLDGASRGRLGIDKDKFDPAYAYRWAVNTPERLAQLTKQDDWDLVDDPNKIHATTGEDSYVRRPSGEAGMVLVKKPKEYYEQDQLEKQRSNDERAQLIGGGKVADELGASGYVPTGGIVVKDK